MNYDELFDGVEDETMVVTEEKISSAKGYLYVLPSIGITLGRLLHFGTSMMYLLGRLFNYALFVLVGFFAIRFHYDNLSHVITSSRKRLL